MFGTERVQCFREALYDLAYEGLLPERCAIVGSGGSRLTDAEFRDRARAGVEEFSRHRLDDRRWQAFEEGLSYVSAALAEGHEARGYLDEELVAPDSEVETFVAQRAWIDNERWRDVPFLLRAGKRLPHRITEVAIVLRESERALFAGAGIDRLSAHQLALRIQPDEGISLVFRAKEPGPGMALDAVPMDFAYGGSFRTRPAEAYERLLYDAMADDRTLFLRQDAVERSWEIVAPVLDGSGTVHPYAAGTWGPRAANDLAAPRAWRP